MNTTGRDINVTAYVKGEERYIFLFDDAHQKDCIRLLGRFAANPELSFDWRDAAKVIKSLRRRDETRTEGLAARLKLKWLPAAFAGVGLLRWLLGKYF